MKKILVVTMMTAALFTVTNAQAELETVGAKNSMKMELKVVKKDTSSHHRLRGSSLHETAANHHTAAAKHHKIAAAKYRSRKDSEAETHAKAAIVSSEDAIKATNATKSLLTAEKKVTK